MRNDRVKDAYKDGQKDVLSTIGIILSEVGGADATDEWAKGFDAAVNEIESLVEGNYESLVAELRSEGA